MAHADWLIDMGPGAGHDGGRVVFEGTPAHLVARAATDTGSLTGRHLREYVSAGAPPAAPPAAADTGRAAHRVRL
jgi:excinuclease UvrABC ATPase subunit